MKRIHGFLISIAASFGCAIMIISILSVIDTINVHVYGQTKDSLWATYLESFNTYEDYEFYFFLIAFIFFFLFLVIRIHKKSLRL